jgi:hypothetical protein
MPTRPAPIPIKIDVVAFEDPDGFWIAQGIQYDIVAQAKSVAAIRKAFSRQLAANVVLNAKFGREGLEGIPPAPEKFKRMFEAAGDELRPVARPAYEKMDAKPVQEEIDIRVAEAV